MFRLIYDYIKLNFYLIMCVSLVVQILSFIVVVVLKLFGFLDVIGILKLCEMVDFYFDCFNVCSMIEYQRKRKLFFVLYRLVDDLRFFWLINDFFGYLRDWKDSIV